MPFEQRCKAEFEGFIAKYAAKSRVVLAAHNGKRYKNLFDFIIRLFHELIHSAFGTKTYLIL